MKLFVLKSISFLVMLAGIIGLAHRLGYMAPAEGGQLQGRACYASMKEALPDIKGVNLLTWSVYGTAVLLGLYGFIPRFPSRGKSIVFPGQHGPISIALKPIENTLHRVLRRMPEVAKFQSKVRPADNGNRVRIDATVVLQAQPAERARKTVELIHEYIAQTASRMLGLEDISTITLNVEHIKVDAKKASKMLHEEVLERERVAVEGPHVADPELQGAEEEEESPENAHEESHAFIDADTADDLQRPEVFVEPVTESATEEPVAEPVEEPAWAFAGEPETQSIAPESLPEALPEALPMAEPMEDPIPTEDAEKPLPPLSFDDEPEAGTEPKKADDPWSLR